MHSKNEVLTPHFFLQGGGISGNILRNFNWATTSLGFPDTWPLLFKGAVKSMLDSYIPTCLFLGPDFVHLYNDLYTPFLENQHGPEFIGQAADTTYAWQNLQPVFMKVLNGESIYQKNIPLDFIIDNKKRTSNVDIIYTPVYHDNGTVGGVQKIIIQSAGPIARMGDLNEHKFRNMVIQAPVAISVFKGKNLIAETVNDAYLPLVGKTRVEFEGKSLFEVLPETREILTPIIEKVIGTGVAFKQDELKLVINRFGRKDVCYFNFIYEPLRELDDSISGIMVVAHEVTEQVLFRQRTEEAKKSLQEAIELANLATWELDFKSGILHYDARLRYWCGFDADEVISIEKAYEPIDENDRDRVEAAILNTLMPGSESIYDVEYKIRNLKSGWVQILHALGRSVYNRDGEISKITGTVQDVTAQRLAESELKKQVEERTNELATFNTELQLMNLQLASLNDELLNANRQLLRSNEELTQYAYIASHDLQEPLRKIRMFSSILKKQPGLIDGSDAIINKIAGCAERMSLLIHDVLEFSKLLNSDKIVRPVDLNHTVSEVLTDFELLIAEKQAHIVVRNLPVVNAVALQMNQLFYNVINNALKFTDEHVKPVIVIDSILLDKSSVMKHIDNPSPDFNYFDITITDNGVGFDPKYAQHILEVFKRLVSKDIFPGSGIGLALCRKITANHGGNLYAESKEGEGSTFHIILPSNK